jgi:hypothetical protein
LILGIFAVAACSGKWTLDWPTASEYSAGTGCDPGGANFDDLGSFDPVALTVGEAKVVWATLDRPIFLCPDRGSEFKRLEWVAQSTDLGPQMEIQARLVSCEACTVLFEGHPSPSQVGVKGAATLHRSRQRVAFEVAGRASGGHASFHLFACTDEFCSAAATSHLIFAVTKE